LQIYADILTFCANSLHKPRSKTAIIRHCVLTNKIFNKVVPILVKAHLLNILEQSEPDKAHCKTLTHRYHTTSNLGLQWVKDFKKLAEQVIKA
jgi:predicted transcriptional regulator